MGTRAPAVYRVAHPLWLLLYESYRRMLTLRSYFRRIKVWLTSGTQVRKEELVNEDSDTEYSSDKLDCQSRKRKNKYGEVEMIKEDATKEEILQKYQSLSEQFVMLKDQVTRLEFEVESLKDVLEEREEEMQVNRGELLQRPDMKISNNFEMEDAEIESFGCEIAHS